MTHTAENFICDEAAWLGNEIRLLAADAGFPQADTEQIRQLTERLAAGIFSRSEICLPITSPKEISFLRERSKIPNPIISADPDAQTPLIFDDVTLPDTPTLYFKKQFSEEVFIAHFVRDAANAPESPVSEHQRKIIAAGKESGFGFPLSSEQKTAVEFILRKKFTVISGGPGTGKTSLLLRALIAILFENPNALIKIAAPTGKAVARIRESITKQLEELDPEKLRPLVGGNVTGKIPEIVPVTLHRLLGTFRKMPFFADVVIVDEASMVSQDLAANLLRAMPADAKLVFLGDKNQLDSVQPGHVFGDFYVSDALAGSRTSITQSHRFSQEKFIGRLANAVLGGKSDEATKILSEPPPGSGIECCSERNSGRQIERILEETFPPLLKKPTPHADPRELLLAAESSRVLSPVAEGAFGVKAINDVARRIFSPTKNGEHFHGRPILILKNVPDLSLSNGDTGIILRNPENNRFYAWFLNDDGTVRSIATAFLPEHETAYAMTIHKSQGSEFSRLGIFFPKALFAASCTRQLLYTAITRFKETPQSRFSFCFDADSVARAVATATHARSLLPARLK